MTRDKSSDPLNLIHSAMRPLPADVALGPVNFAPALWACGGRLPVNVAPYGGDSAKGAECPGRCRTIGATLGCVIK